MIVRHKDFEFELDYSHSSTAELVIESKEVFTQTVLDLYDTIIGESSTWIFTESNAVLAAGKTAFVICDYFTLEPTHSRTIMSSLFKRLCAVAATEEYQEDSLSLLSSVEKFGYELIDSADFSFEMTPAEDFSISSVVKSLGIKIHLTKDNIVDRILEYSDVLRELLDIRVVALVNLHQFVDTLELERLCTEAVYHDTKLLLLNSSASNCIAVKRVIIDNDLCEIEKT